MGEDLKMKRNPKIFLIWLMVVLFFFSLGSQKYVVHKEPLTRMEALAAIPKDVIKGTPEKDFYPPVLLSDGWEKPIPLEGPINTGGAEDAPVIAPDGNTFFFFFTPDVRIPANRQLIDGVTGIWWSKKVNEIWNEPERVVLNNDLALDGPFCIQGNTLWFGSYRVGNLGKNPNIYTATCENGKWIWQNAGQQINLEYKVGELYTTQDGQMMVFQQQGARKGCYGAYDLWEITKTDTGWTKPVNLGPKVNTKEHEGWPCLSPDGKELWFTRLSGQKYPGPAIFRSVKEADGTWSAPEEIIAQFAGDPAIDGRGNIYFTHHYYSQDLKTMIEADIYVAYRK
jgi:hypothetical protein